MRRSQSDNPCAISGLLAVLTGPWTLHILWVLSNKGATRFGELRRLVNGISSRVLTERLRLLEKHGFVYRHYEPTIPPSVTYGITAKMKDIQKVLHQFEQLARKWQDDESSVSSHKSEGVTREVDRAPAHR